jgi:UDPglucose--hexose-1-phosphate uridylyltransferase
LTIRGVVFYDRCVPELRRDPVTGNWVIVGYDAVAVNPPGLCPFCPGNERLTPPTIREVLGEDGLWHVRCVSALNSVFAIEASEDRRAEGLYDKMGNVGAHEIIVDHRDHEKTLGHFTSDELVVLLKTYMERMWDLRRDPRFKSVQAFRNRTNFPETHIPHPHSHILAAPVVPKRLELELTQARAHFMQKERCLFCDVIHQEIRQNKRVVSLNSDFVVLCPFASRAPFEAWVLPRAHEARFETLTNEDSLYNLAAILLDLIRRIERVAPAETLLIHTAPNVTHWGGPGEEVQQVSEFFHWHVEVLPRDFRSVKYKLEDEFYVLPDSPEVSAAALRALKV